jgi:hypothetical protein
MAADAHRDEADVHREEAVGATYGHNSPQLVRVKRAYDPDNLFRTNRNVLADVPDTIPDLAN